MENKEYSQIVGNSQAPYVNGLATRFGLATNVYAKRHPSLPNYLTLIGGTNFGITDDCTSCSVEGTVLTDQLQAKGIDWRAYQESAPGVCPTYDSGLYAKRHDPFVYVRHIVSTPAQCNKVVPFTSFSADLNSANPPSFAWISPNLCDDTHDCSIGTGDTWLRNNIEPVLSTPWYRAGGVVIVTWDEGSTSAGCCLGDVGGHIPLYVISAHTPAGARYTNTLNTAGILRGIEHVFGLPYLADAGNPASGELAGLLP